jgi:hypothetical protein
MPRNRNGKKLLRKSKNVKENGKTKKEGKGRGDKKKLGLKRWRI